MAKVSGNSGDVTVAGAQVAELIDFSWDEGVEIIDSSAIGDDADVHLVGTTNWNGSITCHQDEADATGQEAMTVGASLAIVWHPRGNTSGNKSYTGTVTIAGVGQSVARNAVLARSFTVTGNGALVIATVA